MTTHNDNGEALSQATQLAALLHRRHYPEVTGWEPATDLPGLLSQIEDMTAGMVRQPQAKLTHSQIAECWGGNQMAKVPLSYMEFADRLQLRLGIGTAAIGAASA